MLRFFLIFSLLLIPLRAAPDYEKEIEPLLEAFCFDCHGDGTAKGEFSMDEFGGDLSKHLADQDHWLPVWLNLRSQIMPPSDEEQPTAEEKRKLLGWIEEKVFRLDPDNPDPGRVTIRRLNRTEYEYAIYDLLGVEFDTSEFFPPDDSGYGFDNNGDVLSISPLLMEKYIEAANEIVNRALPEGASAQVPRRDWAAEVFKGADPLWMPFAKAAEVEAVVEVEWPGNYEVTLEYAVKGAVEATVQEGHLRVTMGENEVGQEVLGWEQAKTIQLIGKADLAKGSNNIAVRLSPHKAPYGDEEELALSLQRLVLRGPLDGKQTEYSKGYQMIFVDGPTPEEADQRYQYARKIMRSFVSRAFRRPLDTSTIDRLVEIVKTVDTQPGRSFEDGIRTAIATCLCSPRFLFRVEIQAEPNNPAKIVPLDEYALASRLSFFLWNSVPDDELLSLAFKKELRKNLGAQIDRMLADSRSERFVKSFTGQWLQLRDLATLPVQATAILGIDSRREAGKIFDVRLREDMRKETEHLFDFILRKDRPVEEFISARYTFLNERLAEFYGIEGVKGENFQPVDLTVHPERGGILTHGSYLLVSSNPTRTSPVKRGLFVLNNLLGTPAPPAPPNVPELEEAAHTAKVPLTMREQMQVHRDKPDCRGCHARMDPIGLGLENFDALGRFRKTEAGKEIDSAGVLVTGEKFQGVAELKEVLATSRKNDFYRCLSEKLLTYALGRGVEYYDAPTVNALTATLHDTDGNLKSLVVAIIESAPFQKRRGSE